MSTADVNAWLAHCRPLLPLQNPLWAFVHNNVLQAFENRPFAEGVHHAAALYRARPYPEEAFFRAELARGRIHPATLARVLRTTVPGLHGSDTDVVERFLADATVADDRAPYRLVPGPAADHMVRYSVRDRPLLDLLVPLVATTLDQGMASWANPLVDRGLWGQFEWSLRHSPSFSRDWHAALVAQLDLHAGCSLDERIAREVRAHAPAGREAEYCLETLFVLKGWSGMVHRLEVEPDLAPQGAPGVALRDWLAVMLTSVHALEAALHARGEDPPNPDPVALQTVGLGRLERWQQAYEESFAGELLAHLESGPDPADVTVADAAAPPQVQVMLCIDDRLESFCRAVEANPGVETLSAVGFFGVDMRYQALGASKPTRQCPPVVEPRRMVTEVPLDGVDRGRRVRAWSDSLALAAYYQSRSLVRGFVVSLLLGLVSFVPLVLDVMLPGATRRWRNLARRLAFPQVPSRLDLSAYAVDEQATVVETMLRTTGMAQRLAPLVAVVGHGSTTTNNPFRQAYGCGACSGNPGAPNARAFATMANDPAVRARLAERGTPIPTRTLFVPLYQDTTTDEVRLLDTHQLPADRLAEATALQQMLVRAAQTVATERVQRLVGSTAGAAESTAAASAHVFARGHDLAQPRPEIGHSRVGGCVVGRRSVTRGIFLDRRMFLVGYDPTTDDEDGRWLASAVLGSVPVVANIALDYFFSRVDPDGFGCGSKLPLNVVSLLGVVTGSKSDLRLGLARQMVELHEPMRPLVLVEAPAARLERVVFGHARLRRLVEGAWFHLGRVDPDTRAVELWRNGSWIPWRQVLPEAPPPRAAAAAGARHAVRRRPPVLDVAMDRVVLE